MSALCTYHVWDLLVLNIILMCIFRVILKVGSWYKYTYAPMQIRPWTSVLIIKVPTFQVFVQSSICFHQLSDWSDDEDDNVDGNVNRSRKVWHPLMSYSPHVHTLQLSRVPAGTDTISDDDDDDDDDD